MVYFSFADFFDEVFGEVGNVQLVAVLFELLDGLRHVERVDFEDLPGVEQQLRVDSAGGVVLHLVVEVERLADGQVRLDQEDVRALLQLLLEDPRALLVQHLERLPVVLLLRLHVAHVHALHDSRLRSQEALEAGVLHRGYDLAVQWAERVLRDDADTGTCSSFLFLLLSDS